MTRIERLRLPRLVSKTIIPLDFFFASAIIVIGVGMLVKTKDFGQVEIDDRQRLVFPRGLFGFEKMTDWAMLDARQKPFFILQSLQDDELAFLLVDPFLFCPSYELNIDDDELAAIKISSPNEIIVFSIVTVPSGASDVTANLQGPIIVNKTAHLGMQVIVDDPRWRTKHSIFEELRKGGGKC